MLATKSEEKVISVEELKVNITYTELDLQSTNYSLSERTTIKTEVLVTSEKTVNTEFKVAT